MDRTRDEPIDDAVDQEERPLQQRTLARVRAALELLPVDLREVIVLREIEGMSYKEIAAVLRIPIGGVMSRLARARERLVAVLKLAAHGDAAVSCEDVGRDLDAHVDREFGAESTIVVGDHLSGCAACRQRVAERKALGQLVRSAPYYSAPDRLRARVLEQPTRSDSVRHFLT
jgi:hypothetical protein